MGKRLKKDGTCSCRKAVGCYFFGNVGSPGSPGTTIVSPEALEYGLSFGNTAAAAAYIKHDGAP